MIRQSLKGRGLALSAGWQAHPSPEDRLSSDPAELNQPDDGRRNQRKEAQGQPIIIAQDTKACDPPNRRRDHDPLAGKLLILRLLLRCPPSTPGFLVWGGDPL